MVGQPQLHPRQIPQLVPDGLCACPSLGTRASHALAQEQTEWWLTFPKLYGGSNAGPGATLPKMKG